MAALSRLLKLPRNLSRIPEVFRCIEQSATWKTMVPAYIGLRTPAYPFWFRLRSGESLRIEDSGDLVTAWIIFFRGEYRVEPSDRTIVDAGANVGAFSLLAARRAPNAKVVAIEPFPETRTRLEHHIASNGLSSRISVRPWALGAADESRFMDVSPGRSQSRGVFEKGQEADGLEVGAISLATLFEREKLDHVDLMKMDIEGGEHETLHAAPDEVLARIDRLALEYHPNGSRDALFARLQRAGFVLQFDLVAAPNSGVAEFTRGRSYGGRGAP